MDTREADSYLETAEDHLKDAELAFKERRYALCVFLSALCAENATSALLIVLGAKPSKKHRNSLVLNRVASSVAQEQQHGLREVIESMKILEPHITKARYPIRKGLELLAPSRFYTEGMAEETLKQARKVLAQTKLHSHIVKKVNGI